MEDADSDGETYELGTEGNAWTDEDVEEFLEAFEPEGSVVDDETKTYNFSLLGYDVLIRIR